MNAYMTVDLALLTAASAALAKFREVIATTCHVDYFGGHDPRIDMYCDVKKFYPLTEWVTTGEQWTMVATATPSGVSVKLMSDTVDAECLVEEVEDLIHLM